MANPAEILFKPLESDLYSSDSYWCVGQQPPFPCRAHLSNHSISSPTSGNHPLLQFYMEYFLPSFLLGTRQDSTDLLAVLILLIWGTHWPTSVFEYFRQAVPLLVHPFVIQLPPFFAWRAVPNMCAHPFHVNLSHCPVARHFLCSPPPPPVASGLYSLFLHLYPFVPDPRRT